MGTDKVNAVIRNKVQMTCITFVYINLTISTLMFKIHLFSAACKGNVIYIDTYYVTVEQLGFNKRCATSSELIEN